MIIVMTIWVHWVEVGPEVEATPPRPPGRDEFGELPRRLNRLRGDLPTLSPVRTPHRPHVPRPDVEPNLQNVSNNRLK